MEDPWTGHKTPACLEIPMEGPLCSPLFAFEIRELLALTMALFAEHPMEAEENEEEARAKLRCTVQHVLCDRSESPICAETFLGALVLLERLQSDGKWRMKTAKAALVSWYTCLALADAIVSDEQRQDREWHARFLLTEVPLSLWCRWKLTPALRLNFALSISWAQLNSTRRRLEGRTALRAMKRTPLLLPRSSKHPIAILRHAPYGAHRSGDAERTERWQNLHPLTILPCGEAPASAPAQETIDALPAGWDDYECFAPSAASSSAKETAAPSKPVGLERWFASAEDANSVLEDDAALLAECIVSSHRMWLTGISPNVKHKEFREECKARGARFDGDLDEEGRPINRWYAPHDKIENLLHLVDYEHYEIQPLHSQKETDAFKERVMRAIQKRTSKGQDVRINLDKYDELVRAKREKAADKRKEERREKAAQYARQNNLTPMDKVFSASLALKMPKPLELSAPSTSPSKGKRKRKGKSPPPSKEKEKEKEKDAPPLNHPPKIPKRTQATLEFAFARAAALPSFPSTGKEPAVAPVCTGTGLDKELGVRLNPPEVHRSAIRWQYDRWVIVE